MKVTLVLLIFLTVLCSSNFALNCQVCQKYGAGICETAEDNGVSMECPPDLNACWYIYEEVRDEIIIIRQCGTDLGESNCVTESEGDFSATACSCLTDNCNMEDNCTCNE